MLFTRFFLLIVTGSLLHFSSYSQNQRYNGDENNLRMCVQWTDSTEYQTPEFTGAGRTVYKFERSGLSWGIYEEKEIYVATNKSSLNQFNPERKLGKSYYWTLRKTEHTIDGKPIYRHVGNY